MHNGPDGFAWGDSEPKGKRKHRTFPDVVPPGSPPAIALNEASEDGNKLKEQSDELQHRLDAQDKLRAAAREMENVLQRLESMAADGEREAMESLYIVAARAIRALEENFKTHPEAIKDLAGKQIVWPALVSNKENVTEINTKHIKALGLGGASRYAFAFR